MSYWQQQQQPPQLRSAPSSRPLKASNDKTAFQKVYMWRTLGAGVWSVAIVLCSGLSWSLRWGALLSLNLVGVLAPLLRWQTWATLVALILLCAPMVPLHILLLHTSEPRPLLGYYAASHGPTGLLSRTLGRFCTVAETLRVFGFIALCVACGALFLTSFSLLRGSGNAPGWRLSCTAGVCLGFIHSLRFLVGGRDVLSFPIIQRARIFRVKQRLLGVAAAGARTSLAATVVCLVLQRLLPAALPSTSPMHLLVLLLGASLLTVCWEAVAMVVEVVFTERVGFESYSSANPLTTLLSALAAPKQPLIQELALMDICFLAERRSGRSWLRSAVFADEKGTNWAAVTQPCLIEIEALTAAIAAALPQQTGHPHEKDGPARWNAAAAGAKAANMSTKRHFGVAWHIRSRHRRIELCVRSLSALVAASPKEDTYGVAQLQTPSLGECVVSLLSALVALRQYVRQSCSMPSQRSLRGVHSAVLWVGSMATNSPIPSGALSMQEVDSAAFGLEDVVRSGVNLLVCAFGESLFAILKSHKKEAKYGTRADMEACLCSCMEGPF